MSDTFRTQIPGIIPEKLGIIRTFSPFHRREKKSLNSTNWSNDLRPDHIAICENGKNPCFGPKIKSFYRRTPTRISGWGGDNSGAGALHYLLEQGHLPSAHSFMGEDAIEVTKNLEENVFYLKKLKN
jgi:hypothetical protein